MNTTESIYLQRTHDYEWDWDYKIKKVSLVADGARREAILRARGILPLIGIFAGFEAEFVTGIGRNLLGKYVNGTSSHPYFALSWTCIARASEEYGLTNIETIETTIIHEMGHAIQDACGIATQGDEAEQQAEDLAMCWMDECDLSPFFKKLLGK